jgi:hypothetical protein
LLASCAAFGGGFPSGQPTTASARWNLTRWPLAQDLERAEGAVEQGQNIGRLAVGRRRLLAVID